MKILSILIQLLFTLVATAPLGKLRTYNWHISRFIELPDGVEVSRLGINGRAGAETIIDVNVGDVVKVFVTNGLDVPTTLHWHGITQKNTVAMDGPAMVTQCPIPPGLSFEYTWNATDAGTFWWHGHYRGQDGLRGPIVIRAANEPFVYDEERIIFLEDHFYTSSEEEIAGYLRPGAMVPLPSSGLLNHRGVPHRSASENTENSTGHHTLVANIDFQPGRRYLLRVINAAAVVPFNFAIDAHRLTIVQADATDVVDNVTVDGVFVDIGQRYSVIVSADQPIDRYWMRAIMPITKWRRPLEVLGTVTYAGADASLPPTSHVTTEPEFLAENGLQLQNRIPTPAPDRVHRSYVLAWDFHADESGRDNSGVTRGWISMNVTRPLTTSDGVTYTAPTVPTLFQIADGKDPDALPETSIPFSAETDETIDLIFMNREFPPHPMHLHGHTVWVLGSGQAAAFEDIPFGLFKLRNPLRRDTFTVPSGSRDGTVFGWTAVRTIADNPGVWFLHCHLEFHIIAGLAMTFVSGAQTVRDRGVPEPNRQLCHAFAKWQSRAADLAMSSTAAAAAGPGVDEDDTLVVQT
ncbi:ferroxidase fet3 [Geranomyces variabilis]|nr:ferroxidase fet3 [Geranomyces variabilis]